MASPRSDTDRPPRRWNPVKVRREVVEDLDAIEDMYLRLPSQAVSRAADAEIPGGNAMVMLGPGADLEAWGFVQLSAIFGRLNLGATDEQRKRELADIVRRDLEPPLSFLASWADVVREERGQLDVEARRPARIGAEITYLRGALDWMLAPDEDGTPWWLPVEDFTTQLHELRTALEEVLYDGERDDTGAPCLNVACGGVRLVKEWAPGKDATEDRWHCPRCDRWYDEESYRRAVSGASKLHADSLCASDIEEVYRVNTSTLRTWVQREKVRRRGRDSSGRQLYDVRDTLKMRDVVEIGCGS